VTPLLISQMNTEIEKLSEHNYRAADYAHTIMLSAKALQGKGEQVPAYIVEQMKMIDAALVKAVGEPA
jgi:hypothetical protein